MHFRAPPEPPPDTKRALRRQTAGCHPDGVREEANDMSCTGAIGAGASGYCDCDGDGKRQEHCFCVWGGAVPTGRGRCVQEWRQHAILTCARARASMRPLWALSRVASAHERVGRLTALAQRCLASGRYDLQLRSVPDLVHRLAEAHGARADGRRPPPPEGWPWRAPGRGPGRVALDLGKRPPRQSRSREPRSEP